MVFGTNICVNRMSFVQIEDKLRKYKNCLSLQVIHDTSNCIDAKFKTPIFKLVHIFTIQKCFTMDFKNAMIQSNRNKTLLIQIIYFISLYAQNVFISLSIYNFKILIESEHTA